MPPTTHPIRVLIADDHPVVRAGLRAVLETAGDIEVVAECSDPAEAVATVQADPSIFDVVLMDLRFGSGVPGAHPGPTHSGGSGGSGDGAGRAASGGSENGVGSENGAGSNGTPAVTSGVEATAAIRALPGAPHVLVVTNYSSDADIVGAVSAGAVGYLLKDTSPQKLITGVRQAAEGKSVLSDPVAGKLMGRMRAPGAELTPRELEVLQLVAAGQTNKQIGRALVLTEATVKSHLVHIFSKLGVESRTAAVHEARMRGIIA